jgi:hypothetical protein
LSMTRRQRHPGCLFCNNCGDPRRVLLPWYNDANELTSFVCARCWNQSDVERTRERRARERRDAGLPV